MFKSIDKSSFYYGAPVVLMTTVNELNNESNITPITSTWTLGDDVVMGIGNDNQGFMNLKMNSMLTLNLANDKIWEKVESISRVTANKNIPDWKKNKEYSYCRNKFKKASLTELPGEYHKIPRIKECPIQLETSVISILDRGEYSIVECKIKNILIDESLLSENDYVIVDKWKPLIYKFRSYTTTTKTLGTNFGFDEITYND